MRVFPLVETSYRPHFQNYSLQDLFSNFANLWLAGVDQPAARVVLEVGLMVLQGDECLPLSSPVYSVLNFEIPHYFLVAFGYFFHSFIILLFVLLVYVLIKKFCVLF